MELVEADFIFNYLSIKKDENKRERNETLRVRVHLGVWELSSGETA